MERDYELLVELFTRKYKADASTAEAWARHFARNQSGAKGKYLTEAKEFAKTPEPAPMPQHVWSGSAAGMYEPRIPRHPSEMPLQVGGMSVPLVTPASMGITNLTPVDVAPRRPSVRDLARGLPAGGY